MIEEVIPLKTDEGHEYLLSFSEMNNIPSEIETPIVDVSLTLTNEINVPNNASTLFKITDHTKEFLDQNNVILYYYCDTSEITKRDKDMMPQEFRSRLFEAFFKRKCDNSVLLKSIIIEDDEIGHHYISLISKKIT